jgi:hemerythrin
VLPEEVLGFLNDWLVTHIGEEDQRVAKHIEMSERRPVGEAEYSNYLSK